MSTYLITYPDGSQITAQGVAIVTTTQTVTIPPVIPNEFLFYGTEYYGGTSPIYLNVGVYSYCVPTLVPHPARNGGCSYSIYYCPSITSGYQKLGYDVGYPLPLICGSLFFTPGYNTTTRCNVQVNDASGNITIIPGANGVACPTWTTTPDGECLPTQIKCPSTTDPRGYCCLECSDIVSKLNTLMV